MIRPRHLLAVLALLPLSACNSAGGMPSAPSELSAFVAPPQPPQLAPGARGREALSPLISYYARKHDIPESLLHRVVIRESTYNPAARNGPYYGLMQILPQTARTMGYSGSPSGLLDPHQNLEYAGRYLRGAWLLADGSEARAVRLYASGYYYVAKRRGMLCETGLRAC